MVENKYLNLSREMVASPGEKRRGKKGGEGGGEAVIIGYSGS